MLEILVIVLVVIIIFLILCLAGAIVNINGLQSQLEQYGKTNMELNMRLLDMKGTKDNEER